MPDVNSLLAENENGYLAIIGALVILTLISVISISASRVANTEVSLARNEVVYQRNFYLAEGAALEAADHLTQYGNLRENTQAWMEMATGDLNIDNVKYYWTTRLPAAIPSFPSLPRWIRAIPFSLSGTRELLKDSPWTWTSRRFMP